MSETDMELKLNLLVEPEYADEFQAFLQEYLSDRRDSFPENEIKLLRTAVKGQSLDPQTIEFIKVIILALGGGVGIAAIIKSISDGIVEYLRLHRGGVVIKPPGGEEITLTNYSASEVKEILESIYHLGRKKEEQEER